MSTMPDAARRRTPPWVTATFLATLAFAAWAALEVFTDTWDSYAYATGTRVTVMVEEPCAGRSFKYSERPDDCPGRWTAGGREVEGRVHLREEVADAPARPFQQEASARGDTAYLRGSTSTHVVGLLAPAFLLAAALVLAVLAWIQRRQERRRKEAWRAWKATQ